MARNTTHTTPPPFKIHKATKQAYVNLGGRRIYLGRHDTPKAREKYLRVLAEFEANGLPPKKEDQEHDFTVVELIDKYLTHCETYYRRADGTPGAGIENVLLAMRPLRDLYASTPAAKFGPLALRAIREKWIGDGLRRTTINKRAGIIRRCFQFGVSHELVPPAVLTALEAVEGLHKGRSLAKESRVVTAVPLAHVEAIKPYVSRQVWGLIQLQLFTGARSGEILRLRRVDIDTSGKIWIVRLTDHKTAYAGRPRVLYFGPMAQAVLREFFPGKGPVDYLFSPIDADRESRERRHAARKTPERYGNARGTNRKDFPVVTPGPFYTTDSYRRAIARGCEAAIAEAKAENKPAPAVWHPHQLRHSAATFIRKEFGLEHAQVILGHSRADVTQIYAEANEALALQVAERMG